LKYEEQGITSTLKIDKIFHEKVNQEYEEARKKTRTWLLLAIE